jgi:hypothetical protein
MRQKNSINPASIIQNGEEIKIFLKKKTEEVF